MASALTRSRPVPSRLTTRSIDIFYGRTDPAIDADAATAIISAHRHPFFAHPTYYSR